SASYTPLAAEMCLNTIGDDRFLFGTRSPPLSPLNRPALKMLGQIRMTPAPPTEAMGGNAGRLSQLPQGPPRDHPRREASMPQSQISRPKLRQRSGVFSHATMVEATGRFVFISGMTARRVDGSIAGVGDISVQTRQVCENLKSAVEAAGGTMDDICR